MKELAGLSFSEDQFGLLQSYCGNDKTFPPSWVEWNQLMGRANASAQAQGVVPTKLELDPAHFRDWCARLRVAPSLDTLRAYAIIHRSPVASSRYGAVDLDSRPVDFG